MQSTVVPDTWLWSAWQPDRNLFFNSFFFALPAGNLVVDPLPPSEADLAEIGSRGGVACIVVTNRDHARGARALADRFGAALAGSAVDAAACGITLDRELRDGDELCGARVIALDGLKTPGELALWFAAKRTVLVGDALWGDPAGSLRLMPDDKLADPVRAVLSLRKLRALLPEHVLVGDGACIFGGAHRTLWDALERRADAPIFRVNCDEAPWHAAPPATSAPQTFGIGELIGADKLGYQLVRIAPHGTWCPLHWHTAEEELYVVRSGTVTLSSPRGVETLRAGDCVAFPARAAGAHRVDNPSDEPCEILMIANVDPADVCYYPNSHKVLVEATGLIVRDHPVLAFGDGE